MACRIPAKKSCSSHLFGGGPKPGWSDGLRAGIIESHNFFVLGPILVKLNVLTRLTESFPMVYRLWRSIEVKFSIPLGAHAERPSIERASTGVTF